MQLPIQRWPRFLPLLVLAACGSGGTSPQPRGAPKRVQFVRVDAPPEAAPGTTLRVRVHAFDTAGIESVEVALGAERRVVSARTPRGPARNGTWWFEVAAPKTGALALGAVLTGADGARRAAEPGLVVAAAPAPELEGTPTAETLARRVEDWRASGRLETEAYGRGPDYGIDASPDLPPTIEDWWVKWRAQGGGQPFDASQLCDGVTEIGPDGAVLRCWLDRNPLIALSLRWDEILVNGQIHPDYYPFWPESRKAELDLAFAAAHAWLASGLTLPFPIPPDPATNQRPPTSELSIVMLTESQAWGLYLRTVAFQLALEIGGFVPWSVLDYDLDDLGNLFHSSAMFLAAERTFEGVAATGYWPGAVLHAYPRTTFQFFVDQDILRPTHHATITRLLAWSGTHLAHYSNFNGDIDDVTDMQAAYMHWNYYGTGPVQRMLAGTIRANTNWVASWTRGCSGTCPFYRSILRTINIPAEVLWGDGEDGTPHLGGHTVPIFPTIGKALSHGDDVLNWTGFIAGITPPPASIPLSRLFVPWDTWVDWFYTHPGDNVGRQRDVEIPLDVLTDEMLDLYCFDQALGSSHAESAIAEYLSDHHTVAELEAQNLWQRLATKANSLAWCD